MNKLWYEEFISNSYVDDDCYEPKSREEWKEYTCLTDLVKEENNKKD